MSKKRSRLDVINDILTTVSYQKEVKPTHILYKSNLSHKMMMEYLNELIKKRFIKEIISGRNKTYSITNKGANYLKGYKTMISFMKSFGLDD